MTRNLTEWEQRALDAPINLSDGHPRQNLTDPQRNVVQRFPDLFHFALRARFTDLEASAQRQFFSMLGQHSAPFDSGRVFSVYSSSVAMTVVANVLSDANHVVALLNPTFDNIHDILIRSTSIIPISELECEAADLSGVIRNGATCIFVTTPNNPTGWYLDSSSFARLARACAETGTLLCLDTSFRGHDVRTQFDCYAILEAAGTEYIVIEDSGKLWPFAELKLGFLAASTGSSRAIEHVLSDVLLTVSPFVLAVVEALSIDGGAGGLSSLHELVAANRAAVRTAVEPLAGVVLIDPQSRVSVCRLEFDSETLAREAVERLRAAGVHLLPCGQFHWARPLDGAARVRLALARDPSVVHDALGRLTSIVSRLLPEHSDTLARS